MKLERLHEYLTVTVITLLGIGFACWCGRMTGDGQVKIVGGIIIAMLGLALCIALRTKLWLIIPLCWGLQGKMSFLPIPFSIRDLAVLSVFGMFLVFIALKMIRIRPHYEVLDVIMIINILYLLTVFIRNPVGIQAFGSDLIGGRPYFNVLVAFVAYWVLCRATVAPRQAILIPIMTVFSGAAITLLSLVGHFFPSLIVPLSMIYSDIDTAAVAAADPTVVTTGESSRLNFLTAFGSSVLGALTSFFRPITLVNPIYFFRFAAFSVSFVLILMSGHRLNVVGTIAAFVLATYFRRRLSDLIKIAVMTLPVLVILLAGQGTVFELPYSVQRSLSFLPGNWDYEVVEEAHGSLEWRWQIWKWALTTDMFIKNKVFGDGFGFTRQQLQEMVVAESLNDDDAAGQISAAMSGGYHSGPVSSIRFVGIVGMILFYFLMIYAAREAFRLIRRAENTPFFILALFVGIPIVYLPINFTFLFGAFGDNLVETIYGIGMLRMLRRSMAQAEAREAQPAAPFKPYIPALRQPIPAGALRAY